MLTIIKPRLFFIFFFLSLFVGLDPGQVEAGQHNFWISQNFQAAEGAVTPWQPSDLAEYIDELDASDDTSVFSAGGNVSTWNGQELVVVAFQQTGASQPTHNQTSDFVEYNNDFFQLSGATGIQSLMFLVSDFDASNENSDLCALISDDAAGGNNSYIFLSNTLAYTASIDGESSDNTGDMTINGYDLEPGDGSGTNISYSDLSGYSPFPDHATKDIIYFQIDSAETFQLLGRVFFGSNYYTADGGSRIYDVIFMNGALSESDRQKLEGWMAHKWGIESQLKTGHPYKSAAP